MLATLNAEWLVWTVKMLSKVFFHDKKMVGQEGDKTNIPQIQLRAEQLEDVGKWL